VKEAYVHHIWYFRLYDDDSLRSQEGEAIEVIDTGEPNHNAGPDFFNAKIKVGETVWAGNVEIHIRSSDWQRHKHDLDRAYDNVVLHVVWDADEDFLVQNGIRIPVLAINELTPDPLSEHCMLLSQQNIPVSIEDLLGSLKHDHLSQWLDRLLIDRLEEKRTGIQKLLKDNQNDWEETAYHVLLQSFGLKVNKQPFEMLARALPAKILRKHRDNPMQLEALLFGQSGILNSLHKDHYPQKLWKEYSFLKTKYALEALDSHIWKFGRLRPRNFPTIRLAQFAQLIYQHPNLFSMIKECKTVEDCRAIFEAISLESYWQEHFLFDKSSDRVVKKLGAQSQLIITINAIVNLLYTYGKEHNQIEFVLKAFAILKEIPSENNSVTRRYRSLGIEAENAAQGQALLQLHKRIKKVQRLI